MQGRFQVQEEMIQDGQSVLAQDQSRSIRRAGQGTQEPKDVKFHLGHSPRPLHSALRLWQAFYFCRVTARCVHKIEFQFAVVVASQTNLRAMPRVDKTPTRPLSERS